MESILNTRMNAMRLHMMAEMEMMEQEVLRKLSIGLKMEVDQLKEMLVEEETCHLVEPTTNAGVHDTQFENIKQLLTNSIDIDFIKSVKTKKGKTQSSERKYIQKIKDIFHKHNVSFEQATSQKAYDFRNVGGTGMLLEIKKTNTNKVIFNDTCPLPSAYYVVFITKENKEQLLFVKGNEFIQDSPWINEYAIEINAIKDKYARGENKQKGTMEVYPRPTYSANISKFII
jgi:hypothetical protein